jgi:hypothetical protein
MEWSSKYESQAKFRIQIPDQNDSGICPNSIFRIPKGESGKMEMGNGLRNPENPSRKMEKAQRNKENETKPKPIMQNDTKLYTTGQRTIGEAYTDEVSQNETADPELSQMLDLSEAISDLAKVIEHPERK